jgi:hypothetical protein
VNSTRLDVQDKRLGRGGGDTGDDQPRGPPLGGCKDRVAVADLAVKDGQDAGAADAGPACPRNGDARVQQGPQEGRARRHEDASALTGEDKFARAAARAVGSRVVEALAVQVQVAPAAGLRLHGGHEPAAAGRLYGGTWQGGCDSGSDRIEVTDDGRGGTEGAYLVVEWADHGAWLEEQQGPRVDARGLYPGHHGKERGDARPGCQEQVACGVRQREPVARAACPQGVPGPELVMQVRRDAAVPAPAPHQEAPAPGVVGITAQRVRAGRGGPEDEVYVSSRRPPGEGGAVSRLANELDQPVGDWPFLGDCQEPGLLGGVMTRLRAHGLRRGR